MQMNQLSLANQNAAALARQPLRAGYGSTIVDRPFQPGPTIRATAKPFHPEITILSVSPAEEDHTALQNAFSARSYWRPYTTSKWALSKTATVRSTVTIIRKTSFPIVVCERDLPDGSWKDMLAEMGRLPDAPYLIVTSRFADDYLWAEALDMGAYDVLKKPLEIAEVARSLGVAWLHWNYRHEIAAKTIISRKDRQDHKEHFR